MLIKKTRHKVFSHEWTDYPSSLFEVDPTLDQGYVMRKGCKSDFLKAVTLHVDDKYEQPSVLPESPLSTVYLIDMMSFIQKYQHLGARTFLDLIP